MIAGLFKQHIVNAAIAVQLFSLMPPTQLAAQVTTSDLSRNLKQLGAAGDCQHDDTEVIQRALNDLNGHTLVVPSGCYRLTRSLVIPLAFGWRIEGESATSSILLQDSEDTPIFVLSQQATHTWEISHLHLQWRHAQTARQTSSVGILFAPGPRAAGGYYQFRIADIEFDGGFRGIDLAPAVTGSVPVWGFSLENLTGYRTMSGATINLVPIPSVGMPRCMLHNIYSSQAITEPQVRLHNCTSGTLDNIEDDNGVDTSIDLSGNSAMTVTGIHIEMHHMVHPGASVMALENSKLDISGVSAYIWADKPGDYFLFRNVAGGGRLSLRNVSFTGASPNNRRAGVSNSENAHSYLLHLGGAMYLTDLQGVDIVGGALYKTTDNATAGKLPPSKGIELLNAP